MCILMCGLLLDGKQLFLRILWVNSKRCFIEYNNFWEYQILLFALYFPIIFPAYSLLHIYIGCIWSVYVCCFKIRMPKVRFVRNLITVPKFNRIRNYLVHENRTFSIVINPSVVLWCSNPCVWLISDSHQGVKREGQLLNGPLPLYLLNPR